MADDRARFNHVDQLRQNLIEADSYSDPDEPGTVTAILAPYVDGKRATIDTWPYVELDAQAVAAHVLAHGRVPRYICELRWMISKMLWLIQQ